jgi:HEAT repeat protein
VTAPRAFSLTDVEHRRLERIDRLVLLGAANVGELLAGLADPSWAVRRAVISGLASLGDDAVGPLCSALREQRSSERAIAAAVEALSASLGESATAQVAGLLGDPRPAVVADAAQILGRRGAVAAAAALAALLDHPDDNVAVAAIEALGAIGGSHAIDALIGVLLRRSFFRAFPALQVLARADDPRVVAPIASLLEDDSYRIEAARALGRSGHAQAIRPLSQLLLRSGDAIVRVVALALADLVARAQWRGATDHLGGVLRSVIGPFLPRFVAALRTADLAERAALAAVLGRIGDASVVPELSRLLDEPEVRAAAVDAIQRITRHQEDALIDAIASPDPATRAAVLPMVGTARAADAVRRLVADEDPEIRAQACEALARIGDTAAVPLLFAALSDSNPRVGHAAAAAIQSLGVPDTAERTIAALRFGTPTVRRYALRIASYMGFAEAFEPVLEAIDGPDVRIAELAVGALAMMIEPRVDGALARLARDPRDGVRAAVMRAAGQRGGDPSRRLLGDGLGDAASWVRYYACQGLGRLGSAEATQSIVERMADAMPHVRIAAVEALAHLATPMAWQALHSAIRSADLDERRAALASIALHPRDEALRFLLDGAGSPDDAMRLIALSGLARRPEPAAVDALASAARSEDPQVRDAALSLLGDRSDRLAAAALVELALAVAPDHPVHQAVSQPSPARVAVIALRLATADERAAGILIAALARMGDEIAIAALFDALGSPHPAVRRGAATALVAIGAGGASAAVAGLARSDPDPEVRRVCAAASADPP